MSGITTQAPTVDSILAECEAEVTIGLAGAQLSQAARAALDQRFRKSITDRLAQGGNWAQDRVRVLPVAQKLGTVAKALAGVDPVPLWAAEAAADAVALDPLCPIGSGRWCPPAAVPLFTVDSVLAECEAEVTAGLGGVKLTQAAHDALALRYRQSIAVQLALGGNWTTDRARALPVARKLGEVAKVLAGADPVPKWAAEAAADAVALDPQCPVGAGRWCPPA